MAIDSMRILVQAPMRVIAFCLTSFKGAKQAMGLCSRRMLTGVSEGGGTPHQARCQCPLCPLWYCAAWRKAGLPLDRLHEAHGSIHHLQCTSPGACSAGRWEPKVRRWEPSGGRVPVDEASLRVAESELPRCPHGCGALARPNVYMFDDDRWVSHRADEQVGKGHPGPPGLL